MSVIKRVPFIEQVCESLSDDDLSELRQQINSGDNVIPRKTITQIETGVHTYLLRMDNVLLITAICIKNNNYTVALGYGDKQIINIYNLNAMDGTHIEIKESCTIEELRRIVFGAVDDDLPDKKPYLSLKRLDDFVYEITYDKLPEYIPSNNYSSFNCTSFVRDRKLYHNLDWTYDTTIDFHIKFKNVEGTSFLTDLKDGELEGKDVSLGQLPYHMSDGRNDNGLMVATHVLYNDFHNFSGTGNKSVSLTLLPYLILTTMSSVNVISSEVQNLLDNMLVPSGLRELEMLIQVLVTDGTTTKLFAPKDNGTGYEYIDISSNPKVSNFKWVNRAVVNRSDDDIQLHPNGIERFNMINDFTILKDLRFTLAYETPFRLSEFIGINNTDKNSTNAELEAIYDIAHQQFLTRTRDGTLWQTTHSVIYSADKMESYYAQENYEVDYISQSKYNVLNRSMIESSGRKIPNLNKGDIFYLCKNMIIENKDFRLICDDSYLFKVVNANFSMNQTVANVVLVGPDFIVSYNATSDDDIVNISVKIIA